ncbi:hypothetical protein EIK77_007477 [Talaromyces pinophilus]|jgi:hypothetical protein|nr:hypothetical protein EIK77_007477 [Talaromyces pinophilus]
MRASSHNASSNSDITVALLNNQPACPGIRAESTPAIRDSASAIIPLEYPVDVLDSIPDAWHSAVDQRPNLVSQKLPTGSRHLRQAGYMQADNSTAAEIQANGYSLMEGEGPSADDIGILRAQHVFDLPSSAVSDSLIETFMERCHPWMPVVERSWLVESDTNKPSILLLQAVFLAACRVSSAPTVIAYASPVEFYRRAKAIFYSGYEKDPLILIAVTCILQWYNPDGPEHVSINTSTMWRYIGVGLAHQIGLHKEPPPGEGASLRRRLWWSLYVRRIPRFMFSCFTSIWTLNNLLLPYVGSRLSHIIRAWSTTCYQY